jgi:hypothetical protein
VNKGYFSAKEPRIIPESDGKQEIKWSMLTTPSTKNFRKGQNCFRCYNSSHNFNGCVLTLIAGHRALPERSPTQVGLARRRFPKAGSALPVKAQRRRVCILSHTVMAAGPAMLSFMWPYSSCGPPGSSFLPPLKMATFRGRLF